MAGKGALRSSAVHIASRSASDNAGASGDGPSIDKRMAQTKSNHRKQAGSDGNGNSTKALTDDLRGGQEADHEVAQRESGDCADENPLPETVKRVKEKDVVEGPQLVPIISQSTLSSLGSAQVTHSENNSPSMQPAPAAKLGFSNLPPELRLRIYRMLFRSTGCITIGARDDFCYSAQFLRTCKLVHLEGRVILYRENRFQLQRERSTRGRFFDQTWTEIGYEDCFRFLHMIGAANISLLRDIAMYLDDGLPSLEPDATRRRYINDQNLRFCLSLLARFAHLSRIKFEIHGRRRLGSHGEDVPFLERLKLIKADYVGFGYLRATDMMSEK